MARSISNKFYNTKKWKAVQKYIYQRDMGMCQACNQYIMQVKAGTFWRMQGVVDHIEELNESNVNDHDIAYGEDNLQLLCLECHNKKNKLSTKGGLYFDSDGDLLKRRKRNE